jgi:endo-1,4-beta-xylanase
MTVQRILVLLVAALLLPGDVPFAADHDCRLPAVDCTLREAADQAGLLIGAAVGPSMLQNDPAYGPALASDFNSLTAENVMKWPAIHPTPGVYNFGPADELVDFAELNGMAVRGHNLLWDQATIGSTPAYVKAITDPDELRALITDHIQTVVGHYQGRVDSWDVVNEPLETVGTNIYDNHFHQVLGPGYIAEALTIAHAADPDAKLFLNEVLISLAGPKFDAFLALLTDLLNQGVPLHGAGIQGHFLPVVDGDALHANIEALAALGLTVELTEVDVLLRAGDDLASRLEAQREEYFAAVRACAIVEACERITTWGFTDRYTWIDGFLGPGFDPLPLDTDYARKPAYFGVRDGLLTRVEALAVPALSAAWYIVGALAMTLFLATRLRQRGPR